MDPYRKLWANLSKLGIGMRMISANSARDKISDHINTNSTSGIDKHLLRSK